MTTYKYKGLSPDGAKLSGVIKAYNEFEAVAQLRETCSVITKIEEVKETQSWNKQIGTKKIKDKELAIICSQFAIILTSGLPIVRCVEMVAAQARTKELQRMLKKVAEDVSGGYSLAQSFENNATGFPTTFIETVRAGEQSGTLEECFEKLHKYYDKTAKMKAKIISTLTYPAIVICVAVIGDYFDNEVSVFTHRLLSMLEPAITIVLAVVTVILLLAVYLPMFTMYGSIV